MNKVVSNATTTNTRTLALASDMCRMTLALIGFPLHWLSGCSRVALQTQSGAHLQAVLSAEPPQGVPWSHATIRTPFSFPAADRRMGCLARRHAGARLMRGRDHHQAGVTTRATADVRDIC